MSQVVAGSKKADPLRQQLDELDQLMERMLALGVQPAQAQPTSEIPQSPVASEAAADNSPEPVTNEVAYELPSNIPELAPSFESPYHSEFDHGNPAAGATAREATHYAPPAVPEPELELAVPAPTFVSLDAPAGIPSGPLFTDFQFAPPTSIQTLERAEAPVVTKRIAPPEPIVIVAWWLAPLAVVNRVHDGSTRWLGPIGRGLRSGLMRNLLGICGLACLLGAVAWMLWEGTDWNS